MNWVLNIFKAFLVLTFVLVSAQVVAGGGTKDADPEGVKYLELYPNLVTNYPRTDGKTGFLSVGIQLKIQGAVNLDAVQKHTPLLQDALVWFLRSQTEETIKGAEKREDLRKEMLTLLDGKLKEETTQEGLVLDVLFTKYIWQ